MRHPKDEAKAPFRVATYFLLKKKVSKENFRLVFLLAVFQKERFASVAQLVEQRTENPRVVGSIPTGGTNQTKPGRAPPFQATCECSSSGRAPPCQGGGSEFEPRHSLHFLEQLCSIRCHSQVVRQSSAKAPLPQFKSGWHLQKQRTSERMSFCFGLRPPKAVSALRDFNARGRQSRPCAKVFTCGENACTAHSRPPARRPGGCSSVRLQRI